jgi:hypothetical protein
MTTVFDQSGSMAGSDDGNTNSNRNFRVQFTSAILSAASGNLCQLTFLWGTAEGSEAGAVTDCWFGQQGATPPDFTGDQVQVFFSGSAGFNGSAAGVVTSDVFTLPQAWDNTKNYVCAYHILSTASANASHSILTGSNLYSDVGTTTSSQTHDASQALDSANSTFMVEKIVVTSGSVTSFPTTNAIVLKGAAATPSISFTGHSGTVTLDFGPFPGTADASVAVNVPAIQAGSVVECWLFPTERTDHTADEHWADGPFVYAGAVTAGVGFTIYGEGRNNDIRSDNPYGKWTVAWCWN